MKAIKLIAAPLAAAAMLVAPTAGAEDSAATEGEIKLAKMLEGRVAGEPQSCINVRPNYDLKMIEGTALVYKSGSTLYVNVPSNAEAIDNDDALVRRTIFGNRICSTDIITTVNRHAGFYTGNIMLGDFVPYRKEG